MTALLGGALALAPEALAAEGRAAFWGSFYADDNGVKVASSIVSGRAEAPGGLAVELSLENDVITGASVDAITTASFKEWTEVRVAARTAAEWSRDGTTVGLAYLPSFEPDYASHGVAAHASAEWLDRRLSTRLAGGFSLDRVFGLVPLDTVWGRLETAAVVDRRTVASLSWETGHLWGYLSSPYLWVEIELEGSTIGDPVATLRDTLPGRRTRHALVAAVRRAAGAGWFASASYRFYFDDWSIRSHTGEVGLERALADDRVVLGAALRLAGQNGARFWRAHYRGTLSEIPYFTSDKLLGPMASGTLAVRAETRFPLGAAALLVVVTKLELYAQRFFDYEPLDWRRGVVGSVGVAIER